MMRSSKKVKVFLLLICVLLITFYSKTVNALTDEERKQLNSMMCIRTKNKEWANSSFIDYAFSNGTVTFSLNTKALDLIENPPQNFKLIRVLEVDMNSGPPSYFYLLFNNINVNKYFKGVVDYNTPQKIGAAANQTLSKNSKVSLKIKANKHFYFVFASTTDYDFKEDENCKFNDVALKSSPLYIYVSADIYAGGGTVKPTDVYIKLNPDAEMTKINCDNDYMDGTFEAEYCNDYKNAINSGAKQYNFGVTEGNNVASYSDYINSMKSENIGVFKCDPFLNLPKKPLDSSNIPEHQKQEEYKPYNTKYIIGNATNIINVGTYVFNFGGQFKAGDCYTYSGVNAVAVSCDLAGSKTMDSKSALIGTSTNPNNIKTTSIQCSVDCTEVVTVQYGAPVASKAGLCFEYKVKVTSRVSCGSKILNTVVPPANKYCTASAYCWDPTPPAPPSSPDPDDPDDPEPPCGGGDCNEFYGCDADHHNDNCEGDGPNDSFDACINECDGGKFTFSCSRSCYNKVYGRTVILGKTGFGLDNSYIANKVGNVVAKSSGCENSHFTTLSDGTVVHLPDGCVAPMYKELQGDLPCVKDHVDGGGIPCYCSCSLKCRWNLPPTCSVDTDYLNQGEYERDQEKNQAAYDAAVKACSSFSKCSSSVAEFTINTSYTLDGGKQKNTIYFPYNSNQDNAKDTAKYNSSSNSVECSNNSIYTSLYPIDRNQCYNCGATNDANDNILLSRTYMMEWGFPGFFATAKAQPISYQYKKGWVKVEGEYCIPANSDYVNQKWWDAYYIAQSKFTDNSLNDTIYGNKNCTVDCSSYVEPTANTDFKINYNINASTRKFGLFGWDIDIQCFYATSDKLNSCNNNCGPSNEYIIRSVQLDDMFPATSGEGHNFDQVGRAPGFNWTEYAKNSKTTNFESDPSAYTVWVQELAENVYSEQYLDYDIYLSKSEIYALRQKQKSMKGFNNVSDDVEATASKVDYDAVSHYQSDLFRGDSKLIQKVNVPSTIALRCNNIRNWKDDSCFDGEDR